MPRARSSTVIGFLGTQMDRPRGHGRWSHWRPTVGLCQHEDFLVRRLVLLHEPRYDDLARQVRDDIAGVSPETAVEHHQLVLQNPWDFEEVFARLYEFARAFPFDAENEDYLIHITTGTHVAQICWFLLTESRHLPARLLQTSPPKGKEDSPYGSFQIIDLDLSRYDRIAQRFAREQQEGVSLLKSGIATRNEPFNRQMDQIEQVALLSAAPILLMGPTGAGKSQLAGRIFELKQTRHQMKGSFVEVNCATLRGDAAMSALFGHKKGAFTGAVQDRPGLLVAADGGLLFLDEIAELGPDEQAMLLRALEEKRFLPVGADRETSSDFQLIAGTNRDLGAQVEGGAFREDLLARINLWTFRLPGLRDRLEDFEPNLEYELDQFARRIGRSVHFNREARTRYLDFAIGVEGIWRGNFRDLNASITRLCTLAHGGRITESDVEEELRRLRADWRRTPERPDDDALLRELLSDSELEMVDRFDRVQLAEVVRTCRRCRSLSEAGRTLFAASRRRRRSTNDADRLRKYLVRFGLDFATASGRDTMGA